MSESNLICLSQIWVKKHLEKRVFTIYTVSRQKCVIDPLLHKEDEKAHNPFHTLYCKKNAFNYSISWKLFTVSKVFVVHHGGKLYIWPFLIQISTFGKWLRLSAKSLLSKTEKTQISEQTQIIWVCWSLWQKVSSKYLYYQERSYEMKSPPNAG